MTREEAARILDPETMWDAYNEITYYGGFNGKKIWLESANEAGRMGAAQDAARNAPWDAASAAAMVAAWDATMDAAREHEVEMLRELLEETK